MIKYRYYYKKYFTLEFKDKNLEKLYDASQEYYEIQTSN